MTAVSRKTQRLSAALIVVAALLFAFAVASHRLGAISFWEDESWMAIGIADSLPELWSFAERNGVHPPLYFYIAWFYSRAAGESEFALRYLGLLVALVGLALTYRLAADWAGGAAGIFAVLLGGGSLFLLHLTRQARQYTLYYALAVAAALLYWRFSRRPALRNHYLVGLASVQAGLLWTHYFGALVAVALGAHGLLTLRGRARLQLIVALAAAGLLFLPWLPSVIAQYTQSSEGLGYAIAELGIALSDYADRISNGLVPLGLGLAALGAFVLWRSQQRRALGLLACWLLLTTVLAFVVNAFFTWYIGRNLLYAFGPLLALYGAGLAWLWRRHGAGRALAASLALLFVAHGLLIFEDFWPHTVDWRSITTRVAQETQPGDLFVMATEPYSLDYYLRQQRSERHPVQRLRTWLEAPSVPDRLWFVAVEGVPAPALEQLDAQMLRTRRVERLPIIAELYQRTPAAEAARFGEQITLGTWPQAEIATLRPGELLAFDLWWRAQRTPETDYSVSVQLWGPDSRIAQVDGGFDRNRIPGPLLPLNVWTPDPRTLLIPADAAPGEYTLRVTVYDWRTGARLSVEPAVPDDLFPLARFRIEPAAEKP